MPSRSMTRASTSPHSSSKGCQSRPFRASRDASKHKTAPTLPAQSHATRRSNPGRATVPLADRPRSSSMISTSTNPRWRATSTRSYCRRWPSRLVMTWDCVDWRTYTTALRLRTVAGSSSELVIFKLLDIEADRLRQHLSQYQDAFVSLGGTHSFRSFGVEQKVHLPSRDRRRQLGTHHGDPPEGFRNRSRSVWRCRRTSTAASIRQVPRDPPAARPWASQRKQRDQASSQQW